MVWILMVWVYMAWAAMVWIDLRLVSLHFLRVEVGIELLSLANNVLVFNQQGVPKS